MAVRLLLMGILAERKEKMLKKVFIVAEAGVNHNGSLLIAKKLIDAAAIAKADAIKFQAFKAGAIVSKQAPKAFYQKNNNGLKESQFVMLKKLELDKSSLKELINYCNFKKIIFLASPFDLDSIDLLRKLGLKAIKIPSGEITNLPYLRKIGALNKKILLSSGMSTIKEIKAALNILTSSGTKKSNITILQCNTEYPTPFEDANLKAIQTLREVFKVYVGYSDHTLGIEIPIAAAALGASVIEKHFTLNKDMDGPDHKASLEPDELKMMIRAIRNTEKALGNGIKKPSKSETKNINIVRKSIIASRTIKKGDVFTEDNITTKRPGNGINPMKWDRIIGRKSKKNFKEDELIRI